MIGVRMEQGWKLWVWGCVALLGAGCMDGTSPKAPSPSPRAVTHVSREDRRDAEFYSLQGLKACRDKKYGRAATLFRKAIRMEPGNAVYHNNLARTLYWTGQYDEARSAFAKAAELDPRDPRIRANMGDVYRQKKDYARAEEEYQQALQMAKDSIEVQARVNYELGNMYLKQARQKEAELRLNRSIDLDPSYHRAYLARLILFHLTRRPELALADLKHLEKNGFEVNGDLRKAVLTGVQRQRDQKRFRPGY